MRIRLGGVRLDSRRRRDWGRQSDLSARDAEAAHYRERSDAGEKGALQYERAEHKAVSRGTAAAPPIVTVRKLRGLGGASSTTGSSVGEDRLRQSQQATSKTPVPTHPPAEEENGDFAIFPRFPKSSARFLHR